MVVEIFYFSSYKKKAIILQSIKINNRNINEWVDEYITSKNKNIYVILSNTIKKNT